jgi:hypothetical protein
MSALAYITITERIRDIIRKSKTDIYTFFDLPFLSLTEVDVGGRPKLAFQCNQKGLVKRRDHSFSALMHTSNPLVIPATRM